MIINGHSEIVKEARKKKELWSKIVIVDRELRKTFPKKVSAKIRFSDWSFGDKCTVNVTLDPKEYKLNEKELFMIYDWLSKYGCWDEKLDYSGKINQTVNTVIKDIKVKITVEGKNSNFCKVVTRSDGRRHRSYSYTRNYSHQLVCQ